MPRKALRTVPSARPMDTTFTPSTLPSASSILTSTQRTATAVAVAERPAPVAPATPAPTVAPKAPEPVTQAAHPADAVRLMADLVTHLDGLAVKHGTPTRIGDTLVLTVSGGTLVRFTTLDGVADMHMPASAAPEAPAPTAKSTPKAPTAPATGKARAALPKLLELRARLVSAPKIAALDAIIALLKAGKLTDAQVQAGDVGKLPIPADAIANVCAKVCRIAGIK